MNEEDYLRLSHPNKRGEPTVCPFHSAPINRGALGAGDRVRCHADCQDSGDVPVEGHIAVMHVGTLAGWYEMTGHPRYPDFRVHRQELELVTQESAPIRRSE